MKMAFWRVISALVSRSATTQPLPIATISAERIIEAVITSIRVKPRCFFTRSLQRMALAETVQPVEGDRIRAGRAVAPVGRRRIAIDHHPALAGGEARARRLHP